MVWFIKNYNDDTEYCIRHALYLPLVDTFSTLTLTDSRNLFIRQMSLPSHIFIFFHIDTVGNSFNPLHLYIAILHFTIIHII